jgi:ATP-dependent DNA ligase
MAVQKKVAELEAECNQLDITYEYPLAGTGRPTKKKETLVKVLQTHHLQERLQGKAPPWNLDYMIKLPSPMLCARWGDLKEDIQEEVWGSDVWALEEKFDGCRCLILFSLMEGIHFYSRHLSIVNYLPNEWCSIYLGEIDSLPVSKKILEVMSKYGVDSFVLDTEIVSINPNINTIMNNRGVLTETMLQAVQALLSTDPEESIRIQKEHNRPLRFWAFDCLHVNGEDLKALDWITRREATLRLVGMLQKAGMDIYLAQIVTDPKAKKSFYDGVIDRGGEGCIAKLKSGIYVARDVRSHRAFVKIKRSVADSIADLDSVDAFVSGWAPGNKGTAHENMIGTVFFSVLLNKEDGSQEEHEIARISSFSDETRESLTFTVEGKLTLNPLYEKKVAAIDGQSVSARERRFKHAKLIYWRTDKDWTECVFDEYTLNNLIL